MEPSTSEAMDKIPAHTASWDADTRAKYQDVLSTDKDLYQTIREGAKVVVVGNDDKRSLIRIKKGKRAKLGKGWNTMDGLIGKPYGVQLDVGRGDFDIVPDEEVKDPATSQDSSKGKSNEKLYDRQDNQKFTHEEITKMQQSMTEKEVMNRVVAGSATFNTKTEFSKAKYLKRKKKRHLSRLTVLPATPFNICETYLKNEPKKSMYLRPDVLSYILTAANVRASFPWALPLSFNRERLKILAEMRAKAQQQNAENADEKKTESTVQAKQDDNNQDTTSEKRDPVEEEKTRKLYLRAKEQMAEMASSLIIATRNCPRSILKELCPYLAGSGCIVVYSEHLSPLKEAADWLKKTATATNVNICDNWFREYQILPQRTHPMMNMNGFSGYLLTAIKLKHPNDCVWPIPGHTTSHKEADATE
eukprot:jgi/Bigna1/131853/aug1.15_g6561